MASVGDIPELRRSLLAGLSQGEGGHIHITTSPPGFSDLGPSVPSETVNMGPLVEKSSKLEGSKKRKRKIDEIK